MKFGRNVVKEETTQKKYQDEDKKSAINKNKFSEYTMSLNTMIFQPHLLFLHSKPSIHFVYYICMLNQKSIFSSLRKNSTHVAILGVGMLLSPRTLKSLNSKEKIQPRICTTFNSNSTQQSPHATVPLMPVIELTLPPSTMSQITLTHSQT